MKIGFNMLLWTTNLVEEQFDLLKKIKSVGYDGAEIPIFGGEEKISHFENIGKALKDNELKSTSVTVIPDEERSPISNDPNIRSKSLDYLKWAIDCSAALGSEVLAGPYHQPLGIFSGEPPTQKEKEHAARVHQDAADYAKNVSLNLSIEPLNRFECYFLNIAEDASDYVNLVDRENFGYLYDTFHANIEEKDPVGVIGKTINNINHIHISENDRGTPGKGNIPWKETFNAINRM